MRGDLFIGLSDRSSPMSLLASITTRFSGKTGTCGTRVEFQPVGSHIISAPRFPSELTQDSLHGAD